jgi:hypothetical protein
VGVVSTRAVYRHGIKKGERENSMRKRVAISRKSMTGRSVKREERRERRDSRRLKQQSASSGVSHEPQDHEA